MIRDILAEKITVPLMQTDACVNRFRSLIDILEYRHLGAFLHEIGLIDTNGVDPDISVLTKSANLLQYRPAIFAHREIESIQEYIRCVFRIAPSVGDSIICRYRVKWPGRKLAADIGPIASIFVDFE